MRKLILLLCVLFPFNSCRQSDNTLRQINSIIKAGINWQVGSYWIMQDSATMEIDSFWVTNYITGVNESTSNNGNNETITILINEINKKSPNSSIVANWIISAGNIGNIDAAEIGFRLHGNLDSTVAVENIFFPTPYYSRNMFNGVSYDTVYLRSAGQISNIVNEHFYIANQRQNGIIYININFGSYQHTWFLKQLNIIRQ